MKKYLKAAIFTLIYIVLPVTLNIIVGNLIKNIGFVKSLKDASGFAIFMILDPISIIALFIFVKWVRKENPLSFAKFNKISIQNAIICIVIGLFLGTVTNSIININAFKDGPAVISGSIDWIIGGNIILVIIATFINNLYKEFCFRGLAFNELNSVFPFAVSLIVQACFYSGELIYFGNDKYAIIYAFLGQVVFCIIYIAGNSVWASYLSQVFCSIGLMLERRTGLSKIFTNATSIVLLIVSIVAITALCIVLYKDTRKGQSIGGSSFRTVGGGA